MDKIIPVSELRSHMSEITKWIESHRQPVFLTKNGRGRYVLLDVDSYNRLLVKAGKAHPRSFDDDDDIVSAVDEAEDTTSRVIPGFSAISGDDAAAMRSVPVRTAQRTIDTPPVERPVRAGYTSTPAEPVPNPRYATSTLPSARAVQTPGTQQGTSSDGSYTVSHTAPSFEPQHETPASPSPKTQDSDSIAAQLREEEQRILRELGLA